MLKFLVKSKSVIDNKPCRLLSWWKLLFLFTLKVSNRTTSFALFNVSFLPWTSAIIAICAWRAVNTTLNSSIQFEDTFGLCSDTTVGESRVVGFDVGISATAFFGPNARSFLERLVAIVYVVVAVVVFSTFNTARLVLFRFQGELSRRLSMENWQKNIHCKTCTTCTGHLVYWWPKHKKW